jgi:tetratricopeptide (TPR) repeat protein
MKRLLVLIPVLCVVLSACNGGTETPYEKLSAQGVAQFNERKYAEAEASFQQALREAEKEQNQILINKTLMNLSNAYDRMGKSSESIDYADRAIKAGEKAYKPGDAELLKQMQFVSSLYLKDARYADAQAMLERIIAQGDKTLTPIGLASIRSNLALMYRSQGRMKDAERINRQALEAFKQELGDEDFHTAAALINLGGNNIDNGNLPEARLNTEKGLSILEKTFGNEHLHPSTARAQLALIQWKSGNKAEAEKIYKEALPALQKVNEKYANTKLGTQYPPTMEEYARQWQEKYDAAVKTAGASAHSAQSAH